MSAAPTTAELPLESKLAFLRQVSSFAEQTYRVEAIETHMSWVFLTDRYAYKLKKPVHYDALDFRSIQARRFYCEEEVRLNRRLAPGVYLGTVPLTINQSGHLRLGNDGAVTDWLVKMRRLPADCMLDYKLKSRSATNEDARRIAAMLAAFYRSSPAAPLAPQAYHARLESEIGKNLMLLGRPVYQLPAASLAQLHGAQRALLQDLAAAIHERVLAGRIVEGHGDLRPEHVCLGPELAIIDCLEFSLELRTLDGMDEIGFLALECERLGAPDFGLLLLDAFQELSGDSALPALVHFYQSVRGCVRARISIMHLDEEKFRYSEEWPRRALEYLQLAQSHIAAARLLLPAS